MASANAEMEMSLMMYAAKLLLLALCVDYDDSGPLEATTGGLPSTTTTAATTTIANSSSSSHYRYN
ncbi:hypothetical protein TYRP_004803 [Tyrophagus putrescentiae]|nr:hypothetical protein TYRP_004803 [Tyrophagus putrescentiae]